MIMANVKWTNEQLKAINLTDLIYNSINELFSKTLSSVLVLEVEKLPFLPKELSEF